MKNNEYVQTFLGKLYIQVKNHELKPINPSNKKGDHQSPIGLIQKNESISTEPDIKKINKM